MPISDPTPITTSPDEDANRAERIEGRLARIEDRIERGNRESRRTGRSFMIFAVGALVIALANLIAVAAELDGKSTTITNTVVRPAATARPAPVPASQIAVGLREFSVQPSSAVGRAGRVTFAVRNVGTVPHELVVLRTDTPANALMKGARADESGNVGETGDLEPGQAKTLRLNLQAGHYALICNLPGHYKAGQYRDFTVR